VITFKTIARFVLGITFIVAGIAHFVVPDFYLVMMPPWLPFHLELIYISGFLEIVFGTMILIPPFIKYGAWGIIFVLLAVFPANIHMALNAELFSTVPEYLLWLRLPFQFVLIGWAWWYTR